MANDFLYEMNEIDLYAKNEERLYRQWQYIVKITIESSVTENSLEDMEPNAKVVLKLLRDYWRAAIRDYNNQFNPLKFGDNYGRIIRILAENELKDILSCIEEYKKNGY